MKKIKHVTPEQIAKIKELFNKGINSYQIAKQLKLAPHVTKYHTERVLLERAKNIDLINPNPNITQERLAEQLELSPKQKNKILLDIIIHHLAVH